MRHLTLIHGRSQQGKDSVALKAEWLDSLREGLAKSGYSMPIPDSNVHFPYYGDTLKALTDGEHPDRAADVIVRGSRDDANEAQFMADVLEEVRSKAGITDEQIREEAGEVVIQRGILNWERTQSVMKAIDRWVPLSSGASIAVFTRDVYKYLTNVVIRRKIDSGVSAAFVPGVENVVVSHSLGTVVAYSILRGQRDTSKWRVPELVTLGSPLGVRRIREAVGRLGPLRCPAAVSQWYNALDQRDYVALFPLEPRYFPLNPTMPAIVNKQDVDNDTENRHGISGYLKDQEVARRIYDALVA